MIPHSGRAWMPRPTNALPRFRHSQSSPPAIAQPHVAAVSTPCVFPFPMMRPRRIFSGKALGEEGYPGGQCPMGRHPHVSYCNHQIPFAEIPSLKASTSATRLSKAMNHPTTLPRASRGKRHLPSGQRRPCPRTDHRRLLASSRGTDRQPR
jgi:hypothetical protein